MTKDEFIGFVILRVLVMLTVLIILCDVPKTPEIKTVERRTETFQIQTEGSEQWQRENSR